MKASALGIVSAAILALLAVAGFGPGIAQAAGNPSDSPAWTAQDQAAADQYKDFLAGPIETGNMPESAQVAQSPEGSQSASTWHAGGPVETGSTPDMTQVDDLDHTNFPREGNVNQYWGADNPSN
jgi:hypothetical protein